MKIERYAVYWVDFNPVLDRELSNTRPVVGVPAVVVSDDAMNATLETVVICPMTTNLHPRWPSRVRADLPYHTGEIAVDQIRTISRKRIGQRIGSIDQTAAAQLRHVITHMYGVLSLTEETQQ